MKATEVKDILGVNFSFVMNAIRSNIITPLVDVQGRGKSREYSYNNLFELNFLKHLVSCGFSYNVSTEILNASRKNNALYEKTTFVYKQDSMTVFSFDMNAIQSKIHDVKK